MARAILVYGLIAGLILAVGMTIPLLGGVHSVVVGYLSMLVALSMVFLGVKRYRDCRLGGVIRFPVALAIGFGIAGVAALFYVLGWEAYLYATNYRFMPDYIASSLAAARANGASAAEIARMSSEFQGFAESYANPLYRMLMTLAEIAPVAVLMPLVSAALLRRPGFMPARAG